MELASFLDRLHLEVLARDVKEALGLSMGGFREAAKQAAARRRAKSAEKFQEQDDKDKKDKIQIVNDSLED